jgi:hypothetical protein
MQKLLAKTESLIARARKLAEQNGRLTRLNHDLENEIKNLREQLKAEAGKSDELNNKIKIIKLAQNIGPENAAESANSTELKRKINEYIREIDNCIMLLND